MNPPVDGIARQILLVMGVSGSGKTSVAKVLAADLGWPFLEGDDLHPAANVAKMHAGQPLTDADRWPWLDAIGAWIDARRAAGEPGIVTCSALKRIYRDRLMQGRPDVRLVYLRGDRALLAQRIGARKGHFMPASLLDSQLATLEPPGPDEHPVIADVAASPEDIAGDVLAQLRQAAR